jgi:hypothetical protein
MDGGALATRGVRGEEEEGYRRGIGTGNPQVIRTFLKP